jgi:hypothetical protein
MLDPFAENAASSAVAAPDFVDLACLIPLTPDEPVSHGGFLPLGT